MPLPTAIRYAFGLGMVMGLRMLGLFMVFPILALYARDLEAAGPVSIGLALGIYGLAQAMLQIPFGRLSDRLGRKTVAMAGFLLFAAGSAVAALAGNIWQVVAGRFLQGSGAVAGVVTAWLADLVEESRRTLAMAVLGLCIGLAFMLSMLVGPLLADSFGLAGVFWATSGLAIIALVPLAVLPTGSPAARSEAVASSYLAILPFAVAIFLLHAVLAAAFLVIPPLLAQAGLVGAAHGRFYLVSLLASLLLTVPLVLVADKWRSRMPPLLGAGLVLGGLVLLAIAPNRIGLAVTLFFGGFNFLEAWLPARASWASGSKRRGEMLGAYTTAQFLGVFAGGAGGGLVISLAGMLGIHLSLGAATLGLLASVFFAAKLPRRDPVNG